MTGVHHTYTAPEVDQPVAVGISDYRAFCVDDGNRRHGGNASGHRLGAPIEERTTVWAGDLRNELDDARHLHPEGEGCDIRMDFFRGA
jgi:hypothetical protein